eukprot:2230296-Pleurochrysis_carterae.AAC.1
MCEYMHVRNHPDIRLAVVSCRAASFTIRLPAKLARALVAGSELFDTFKHRVTHAYNYVIFAYG